MSPHVRRRKRKANLLATLGPGGHAGGVLSGHTDVVPVDGQAWMTDPFEVVEKEGRLYGRGTSDMKSFIAVALAMVPEFVEGAKDTAAPRALVRRGSRLSGGRPTDRRPRRGRRIRTRASSASRPDASGHRAQGQEELPLHGAGLAGHSAHRAAGRERREYAAEVVAFLKGMARRHRDRGRDDRSFDVAYTPCTPA